jgi:hypothetical protein
MAGAVVEIDPDDAIAELNELNNRVEGIPIGANQEP